MTERMIEVDGIELCAESFGERNDAPVLLIQGIGGSMVWWEDEFCQRLADGGRFVIRYDHRDTGRSTTYPHGKPGYTGADLSADALRVLDGYGVTAAHVVGVSAGAGIAQGLAITDPERVESLVLISSSPVAAGDAELPPPTAAFGEFVQSAEVDWSDRDSIVEYLVAYMRLLAGGIRPFDEDAQRAPVRADAERATDIAAVQNHDVLDHGDGPPADMSAITAPTLVIHGTADPMFPPEHGEALANAITGAELMLLPDAGHAVDRADWDTIIDAVLDHTAT